MIVTGHFSDVEISKHRAVGVDAEWNHHYGMRAFGSKIGNILIISICTPLGYCALFRMNKFDEMPKSLKVNVFSIVRCD